MSHPLPLTGERTLPGVPGEEYWFARHKAAYSWVTSTFADLLRDAVVVEAGSGEGYGAALLREAGARAVVALEYDEAAAQHAVSAYPHVRTTRANLAAMPIGDSCADLVVSLQVVEHLWDLRGFLRDCARILGSGGRLVVSTPNRLEFSPGLRRGERPTNPFHVEEFDAAQLADLMRDSGFTDVTVRGLHHGTRITAWESTHARSLVSAQIEQAVGAGGGGARALVDPFVASVTAADFVVGEADGAQDLIAVAATR